MKTPFASLSHWRQQRRRASSRALAILATMLGLAVAMESWPGAGFAIVCLGAALSWVVGVQLVGLELALLALARRHRLAADWQQQRLVVLAVLAFACEAGSAAGITGLLFIGEIHPLAVVCALAFGALALLWNRLMVRRWMRTLASELEPRLPARDSA